MGFFEIINYFKRKQTIDITQMKVDHLNARGIPAPINKNIDCKECRDCEISCPTKAIQIHSNKEIEFDYGSCLHCGLCVNICEKEFLQNTGFILTVAFKREELKIKFNEGNFDIKQFPITENVLQFQNLTHRRGFKYREVAAAGNNSVEMELNASFNNVFDSEGHQFTSVASPKHADAIVFSGPISQNMEKPLQIAWDCMPEPKALIAGGTEAISGGIFEKGNPPKEPDLFISGDPPRPDTLIFGFLKLTGRVNFSFQDSFSKHLNNLRSKK
jgi:Ni,Fe-hydrogenase III small subunit/Pyruvate/2-oxoacid:ferredoxin oxidoreductase delta subunit